MAKSKKFKVEITATALAEVEEMYAWLAAKSPISAQRWRGKLLKLIDSLESFPGRYPIAPESVTIGREIRYLIHGKRSGVIRILFEVLDDTVYVFRIRHGART